MRDTSEKSKRIIVAADNLTLEECINLTAKIGARVHAIKVHEVVDRHGPIAITRILEAGAKRVFDDAKLHDIPNTVKLRAKAIAESGASILTVHASGEIDMMMEAVTGTRSVGNAEIFAITVLTSLDEEQAHLTYGQPSKAAVLYLARLAKLAGVHGVVCSPKEVGILAKRPELKGLKFIVPGIRSAGKDADDQRRFDTPGATVKAGATYLVIGRQLTQATDQVAALEEIEAEIQAAENEMFEKERRKHESE